MNNVSKTEIKFMLRRLFPDKRKRNKIKSQLLDKRKKVFLMNTPSHGNIGDQAIALAEIFFLKKHYPNYHLIEVPSDHINHCLKDIKSYITDKDLIFVHGGGNLGNLYIEDEVFRRLIVKNFPKNKSVSFPQSIKYTEDLFGKKELEKAQRIYSKNSNWYFTARESASKELMSKIFSKNKIFFTPDIVLSMAPLPTNFTNQMRKGAITLFRKDKEKSLSESFSDEIIRFLECNYSEITFSDTTTGKAAFIDNKNRREIVLDKWLEISHHELAITDRLHGMIFCYLTKTPCVVIKNNNNKIESTYNSWVKDCNFIQLLEENTVEGLTRSVKQVLTEESNYLGNLNEKFSPLIKFANDKF